MSVNIKNRIASLLLSLLVALPFALQCQEVIFSASGGFYEVPFPLTLSCADESLTIHYTTNGSTPTTASPQYTEPFTLSSDCTVKAVAILDGEVSDVVFANYTFRQANDVASIAEAVSLPDGKTIFDVLNSEE